MRKNIKDIEDTHMFVGRPPKHLGKIGAAMWRKLVPVMNNLNAVKKIDENLVELYCSQYEIYRKAYEHIQLHGNVLEIKETKLNPRTGEIVSEEVAAYRRNPSTQIYNEALTKLVKIGSELGLSPKSREEILSLKLENTENKQSTTEQLKAFFD